MDTRPPVPRWLAALALVALVAVGSVCAWSILTDRAVLRAPPPPEAPAQKID